MTIYFISDTHFDDESVIEAYNRPFASVKEMNHEMLHEWNETVSESDEVLIIGDFAVVEDSDKIWEWIGKLNGDITIVAGNHRPIPRSSFSESELPIKWKHHISVDKHQFVCAHKPSWLPENFEGWKIHGHVHNKSLEKYPFINSEEKRINVSAELLNYTPISLDQLIDLINNQEDYSIPPHLS